MVCGRALYIVVVFVLLFSFIPSLQVVGVGGAYRTPITVTNNVDSDLTDYQVKIMLDSSWDGWDQVGQDGSDIYFLDQGNNPLYYWIEEFDYTNKQAIIWVKVPSIPASSSVTIYMYYGGTNPYSNYNDPSQVFLFYEDFETWSGWVIFDKDGDGLGKIVQDSARAHSGSYSAHKIEDNDPDGGYKEIGTTIGRDVVLECWVNRNSAYGGGSYDQIFLVDDNGNGYNIWYDHAGDKLGITKRASYASTVLNSVSATDYMDVWIKFVFIIKSDGTIIGRIYQSDGTLVGEVTATDTTYSSFTRVHIGGGYDYWVDDIILRKHADPEPDVSIGSSEPVSQGDYPWFSASVSPTSVSVEPSQTMSFNVNVTNTGNIAGWVVVELIDHNNVSRANTNITLDPGAWQVVALSTTAEENERGDWTWHIIGHNDTTTFFNISVSVSIHYSLSYSYSYSLGFSAVLNSSSVSGIRYNYTLVFNATGDTGIVGGRRYGRVWGLKYGLAIYTNSTGDWSIVYEERGATVYTLYVRFVYNVTAPYPDVPDASVRVYDADSGDLLSTIYVPFGNTSITLYANKFYRFEIPGSGATVHGYCFKLSKYEVNGVVNPASVLLDRDSVLTIYYDILNGTCSTGDLFGASFSSVNIGTVGSRVGVYSFSGQIYGGDVFDGYEKIVNGLIEEKNLSSNWVGFGSYDSVVVQYYSPVSTPVKGAGFYEGGNYYVVGYYMNVSGSDTRIVGGRFLVDVSGGLQRIVYVYQDSFLENYQSYEHYAKLVFYKGDVLAMIYANGQWYRLAGSLNNTAVSYAVFIGSYHPNSVLIMRGDYIVFQAPGLKAVEIRGFDAAGNSVSIAVADNAPGDADPREGIIMVQELPVLYPLNATVRLFLESVSADINYGLPGISGGQWVNVSWGNITISTGNSSLVDAVKDILEHPYGRIVLGLLPIILMLYPNRKYGALMGLFAVGLLGFFNIVAITSGLGPVVEPAALILSFIVLGFGLLYEVR